MDSRGVWEWLDEGHYVLYPDQQQLVSGMLKRGLLPVLMPMDMLKPHVKGLPHLGVRQRCEMLLRELRMDDPLALRLWDLAE